MELQVGDTCAVNSGPLSGIAVEIVDDSASNFKVGVVTATTPQFIVAKPYAHYRA